MQRAEQVVAALCVLLGAGVVWQAWTMEYLTSIGPGPGFFPFWLGLILVGLSVAWLVTALRPRPSEATGSFFPARHGMRRIACIGGAVVGAGAIMEIVGFQLTMFAFVVWVLTALGWRRWALTIVLACVLSVGIYQTFTRWLDVVLPQASIMILRQWGF